MTRLENRYPVYAEHDTAYFRACVENLRRKGAAILSEGVKQMDVSRRETIPEQYVWRMTDIYADDAQWEQDFARVQQMTEEMAAFSRAYARRMGSSKRRCCFMSSLTVRWSRCICMRICSRIWTMLRQNISR